MKTSSIWPTARTRAAFSSVIASAQPAEPSTLKMPTQMEERQLTPDLGDLRAIAIGEVGGHQHDLDGVHAGQRGDAADHEVAVGQQLGGLADRAGGDREDRARQDAVERALVREVGQHAADIGEPAAHAQDRDSAQAHQDAGPCAEA